MAPAPAVQKPCSVCGGVFAPEDLAVFGERSVCAGCKPGFVQSYRQGMVEPVAPKEVRYAGFWIRVCAEVIDLLICLAVRALLVLIVAVFSSRISLAVVTDLRIIGFLLDLFYFCFFWTRSGSTPGKMIFGLNVIAVGGGPVRLEQAVKRYFSQWLSGILLGYGFMKAGWSPQKESLSDDIARTRVIYIR